MSSLISRTGSGTLRLPKVGASTMTFVTTSSSRAPPPSSSTPSATSSASSTASSSKHFARYFVPPRCIITNSVNAVTHSFDDVPRAATTSSTARFAFANDGCHIVPFSPPVNASATLVMNVFVSDFVGSRNRGTYARVARIFARRAAFAPASASASASSTADFARIRRANISRSMLASIISCIASYSACSHVALVNDQSPFGARTVARALDVSAARALGSAFAPSPSHPTPCDASTARARSASSAPSSSGSAIALASRAPPTSTNASRQCASASSSSRRHPRRLVANQRPANASAMSMTRALTRPTSSCADIPRTRARRRVRRGVEI